ncbi:Bug family tripartite tricarboxylate transporter substrate binding protein [Teichococcus vastitatis]|uniref:Tripartite tricarboxylate transporter substrate binding protein n=1 Tax=Teichococcus vastitatis TaxID=2307076 RepID=A0ABS9W833_9PROT|nr:tripartite tricarboxylate transporter substrate-binding protein [Pseudoroseomonas vastitatis]MCI0755381.1 tripartite tricarboxylate transporter substrate binding protein [Pseudoroseomonas vastitatis]
MKLLPKATLALGAVLLSTLPAAAQQSWKPTRPIEFVVTSGAGGGTDVFARAVQAAINKHDLVPTSVVVTNKGGGSGVEGYVYGTGAKADPHKVIFGTNNAWTLPMVAKTSWSTADFTPVAIMAFDEFMLWTKADGPYKTAADFVAAARAQPGTLRMGGSQTHDTDQTLTVLIEKAAKIQLKYIPYQGGGQVGVQLAGGHIEANTNNPSESVGGWRGGQVKPVCVFRSEPFSPGPKVTETQGWSDIPTCASQGIPIEQFSMPRTIFLPPGVPAAAQTYWADLFRRVSETPEWKDYVTRTSQSGRFVSGDEMRQVIQKEESETREIFSEAGWLVK